MKIDNHRIVKITLGDNTSWYEIQRKSWFGKWSTCEMLKLCKSGMLTVPAQFEKIEDAEKFMARNYIKPTVEVVKEY